MDIESRIVQVRFFTKLNPPHRVPSISIAIPSNISRFGLSTIINDLIKKDNDDWKTEAFDFLINGELVRISLQEFLFARGISAERILEIEYIKAVIPRKKENPTPHDDWVRAVDGSSSKFILTGCDDGLGRIWKEAGLCTHILRGHTGINCAVTSVCVIQPKVAGSSNDQVVATASEDMTVKLFKVDNNESSNKPKNVQAFKTLHGHTDAVFCISADPSGEKICSGSWDHRIKLWRANDSGFGGDSVSIKKRKKEGDKESITKEEALSTLVGHTQKVSAVVWSEHETIYSASWDHSIRRWDVETGKLSMNMHCGDEIAFNCLDVGGESSSLLVSGGADSIVRIWDPRKPGTLAPTHQLSSHTSWISSCKWHCSSWYHLVSASYDGKVILWDLRTSWPLHVIGSHNDKVLCVDWWGNDNVVSGGADSKLCISSKTSVM